MTGTPMTVAQLRRQSYESLFWLTAREALRVSRLWSQTVLAPVVSSLLFVVVFGLSLAAGSGMSVGSTTRCSSSRGWSRWGC